MSEDPGKETVEDLVKKVHNGDFVIPHFQRGYEWNPRMVCELFESILQDYYAGLLLFWRLSDKWQKEDMWDLVWGVGAQQTEDPNLAILDGQQRLASLHFALYNPKSILPSRKTYYRFYLNLDKVLDDSEDFDKTVTYKYSSNYHPLNEMKKNKEEWIENRQLPLAVLSDSDFMVSDEFENWIKEYINQGKEKGLIPQETTALKVPQLLNKILNYKFVTTTLEENRDIYDICNIFARINQKGMRLSTFDLMNAFLYPKEIKLRKKWEGLDNPALKNVDKKMNEHMLRLISLHKQDYCSSKYIYNLIPGEETKKKDISGNITKEVLVEDKEEFNDLWQKSCEYAERARSKIMNIGDNDFGAIKNDFIPNTTILPVLGAIIWEINSNPDVKNVSDSELQEKLKKWYWSAVLSEDYSGSSDTTMAMDFRDWKKWLTNDGKIRRISRIKRPSFIQELDFKEVKKSSSRYNAILCRLALNNVKDFFTLRVLGTGDFSEESINDHHIFPNKVKGLDPEKSTKFDEYKDSILNRTLLLDDTNKNKIGNKKPSQYLEEMEEKAESKEIKEVMKDHFISEKALEYLREDNFDKFIEEREKSILEEVKQILGISQEQEEELITPESPFSNKLQIEETLKGCDEYIWWVDKYFSQAGLKIIMRALGSSQEDLDIDEVKILTSIAKANLDLRNDFKDLKTELENKGIQQINLRVIDEKELASSIHDRWIISKNRAYNIPSPDVVYRGQYSEIKETENTPPFEEWWEQSLDILEDWNELQKYLD